MLEQVTRSDLEGKGVADLLRNDGGCEAAAAKFEEVGVPSDGRVEHLCVDGDDRGKVRRRGRTGDACGFMLISHGWFPPTASAPACSCQRPPSP